MSDEPDPEDYPTDEEIYGFVDSLEAAGLHVVNDRGMILTADQARVALYDHWGILEADDDE